MRTQILRALLAIAVLLSAAWWFFADEKWEPVISGVLALVGLLSIGRVEPPQPTPGVARRDGLVVLPFTRQGSDDEDDFFADALVEELVRLLSRIESLRVIATSSSLRLRDSRKQPDEIAEDLGVRYLVTGRVRRLEEKVRVSVELVDAAEATQMWSDTFTVSQSGLVDLDERLGRAITDALELTLTPDEDGEMAERGIEDPRAQECYLRAQLEIYDLTKQSLERGIQLLQNGLSMVGRNESLLAALGDAYFQLYNVIEPDPSHLDKAEDFAQQALDLNPDSAPALSVMGLVSYKKRADVQAAVRWLQRSLRSDPVSTTALFWLSYFYAHVGRSSSGRPLARRLVDRDPLIPINHGVSGLVEVMDGRFTDAVPHYRRWHEMNPDQPFSLWAFAYVLVSVDEIEEARPLLARLPMSEPPSIWDRLGMAFRCGLQGDAEGVREQISPDIAAVIDSHEQFSWHASQFYALAGMIEESLAALRNAMELGFVNYPFIEHHDPLLENIRSDARFADLMLEMKARWERFDA